MIPYSARTGSIDFKNSDLEIRVGHKDGKVENVETALEKMYIKHDKLTKKEAKETTQ